MLSSLNGQFLHENSGNDLKVPGRFMIVGTGNKSFSQAFESLGLPMRRACPSRATFLVGLLDYIKEQAKVIDPRGFNLGGTGTFLRRRKEVAGLVAVEFAVRVESDHIWMRVTESQQPHAVKIFEDAVRLGHKPED